MEVLYRIRPYFLGIFPYIGLIYDGYLQFRILKRQLKHGWLENPVWMEVPLGKSLINDPFSASHVWLPEGTPPFWVGKALIFLVTYNFQVSYPYCPVVSTWGTFPFKRRLIDAFSFPVLLYKERFQFMFILLSWNCMCFFFQLSHVFPLVSFGIHLKLGFQ